MQRFFQIEEPESTWGDYGRVLRHGGSRPDEKGVLTIRRAGPYVPPISFPRFGPELRIVATEPLKQMLIQAGFNGCEFRSVSIGKIVESDWHKWDRPILRRFYKPWKKCTENGEPGELLDNQPHSDALVHLMPKLYQLDAKSDCEFSHQQGIGFAIIQESWKGNDLFKHPEWPWYYVTERLRNWFNQKVPRLVQFKDVRVHSDA